MDKAQIESVVEAVLFAHGEPIGAAKLAAALELPQPLVEQALAGLRARYQKPESGLCLLHLGEHWQLATKNECGPWVAKALESRRAAPLTPAALESNKVDGANYFLPYISNAYGVYYNVDMFEENGIEIPTTMDELYAVCEKLKAAGITPIAFSDQETWTLGHLGDRLMGLIYDDDGTLFQQIAAGEASATEHEGMRTVAEVFLKLHEYGQEDSLGVGYEQAISAFANGEAAMMLQGTWLLSLVKSANPDMNVDVFPLPGMTAEETRVGINTDLGLAISETSENKEAALAFLAWLSATENAQMFADMEGSPSLINGVNAATPEFEKMSELISEGKSFVSPRVYWKATMVNELSNVLQRLVSSKDVDLFLQELDESVRVNYAQG